VRVDSLKRLPLYSLLAGALVAIVLLVFAFSGVRIPGVGLGAMGLLPLSAALVDAIRMRRRFESGGAGQGGGWAGEVAVEDSDLQEWLEEKAESLSARERELNARALALQQWMQFPDVMDFKCPHTVTPDASPVDSEISDDDPMARHDRELLELIDAKTRDLFDSIKRDDYRTEEGDRKVFDNQRIRADLVALVSDVAAIYRPGEASPLLKTNVEALSRAVGRASLRLLVAVENLPGGLANYDFQSIYTLVIRAVKTFGMYKSAKPYIDVASGVLFAGRIVSSTNPITLVAWWAASKATTYGASKLGGHVLDQQAVGLIRQLVEIVAVEVASVYSPMVRYRDVHWIYGVELVHLAGELTISDAARIEAMKQLAVLNLRDEYGRVSLMRHLANGSTLRPANYHPADSLSAGDRKIVAERLEAFLLSHVMTARGNKTKKQAIDDWQTKAGDRLEIQFRASDVDATIQEQSERAIWALAAFALHHLGDEPEQVIDRLRRTQTWNTADSQTRTDWIRDLLADPPFLYHPPVIQPGGQFCQRYLEDLVEMAARRRQTTLARRVTLQDNVDQIDLPPWPGEEAIRVTAYFLRADATALVERYYENLAHRLIQRSSDKILSNEVIRALEYLASFSDAGTDQPVLGVFCDAKEVETEKLVHLARIGPSIVCFTTDARPPDGMLRVTVSERCEFPDATVEKVSGYVRSDCRVTFPGGVGVLLSGSALRGYESYFASLLTM
jgi:hypothetical protein